MRFGIDLGGTKTEIIALGDDGVEVYRRRVNTDASSYATIVASLVGLVRGAEESLGQTGSVGVAIPGSVSPGTGVVKNANTTVLIGHALDHDLSAVLGRPVRCANDADCLVLSEATDGAGRGGRVVFAVILGTGCGAGIAVNGWVWPGRNVVGGEWGHNPLPWPRADEYPGPVCWCGKSNCIERWISGTGFADDFARGRPAGNARVEAPEIVAMARGGDGDARAALERYIDRLARSLAHVINILDPDIIVVGGGMSNVTELYYEVPKRLPEYVFGQEVETPVVPSMYGDSSGVRGAAWLWAED